MKRVLIMASLMFLTTGCQTGSVASVQTTDVTSSTSAPSTTFPIVTPTMATTTVTIPISDQITSWNASQAGLDVSELVKDQKTMAKNVSIWTAASTEFQDCIEVQHAVQAASSDPIFPDHIANNYLRDLLSDDNLAASACLNELEANLNAAYSTSVGFALNAANQDYKLFVARSNSLVNAKE